MRLFPDCLPGKVRAARIARIDEDSGTIYVEVAGGEELCVVDQAHDLINKATPKKNDWIVIDDTNDIDVIPESIFESRYIEGLDGFMKRVVEKVTGKPQGDPARSKTSKKKATKKQ